MAQSHFLSDRKLTELKWSHTVNVHERVGCNVPVDLHTKHLNRCLKHMIGNLGSNVHPSAIQRNLLNLWVLWMLCVIHLKLKLRPPVNKGYCSYPSFARDFNQILLTLEDQIKRCSKFKKAIHSKVVKVHHFVIPLRKKTSPLG